MFGSDTQNQPTNDNSSFGQPPLSDPLPNGNQLDPVVPSNPPVEPVGGLVAPDLPSSPAAVPAFSPPANMPTTSAGDDLVDIKQQALQQLSPLVSHLDQSAEEKFRTTMMMIQASDDQSLIKTAFEAAKSIIDDKARAQALLDVINEINYFSQHNSQNK